MRYDLTLCLVLLAVVIGSADALQAIPDKILQLKKIPTAVLVDGEIDLAWAAADSVVDFVQLQPFAGKDPSTKTVAKVFTTEEALYCLMICYDEKKNIQKNTGQLDNSDGDIVSLMLDTFGDRRTAYKFAVTASGVRSDCRLLDDARNRDYSWDGVWFAKSKVYDWGFVIEMRVPYRSIK
ncbi:carbohydrate binding family 9 domain-containing protein, partial [candidate division KSB1 bacterium]|nr:carbohydrate binding family 9 domain-containing protein [candidate division KSB1 bacterium]